jgi:lipid II isoglutaminyl synthase (glutamine-hydrolysing)
VPNLVPEAHSGSAGRRLRVCALYPDLMNIYADRGNLLMLEHRCAWRGIGFELASSSLGEPLDASAHDLFYLGGGQDRDQRLCAADLLETKRDALHEAASRGAIVLGICGGYQLLGRSYVLGEQRIEGVGLLDVETVREDGARLIGNVAIEVRLDGDKAREASDKGEHDSARERVLAGFENHGGRTTLAPGQAPLGRVLRGHGNDGRSGFEGARSGNTIGTYLHGPLLPKNSWFADWLIARAIGIDVSELEPLEDTLEHAAHAGARRVAGLSA